MSGAILATSALADASDNGCANSNGNAAGCSDSDPANGEGHANPDYGSNKHDQTATSEVRVDAYLNAKLTYTSDGLSDGFSSVKMSMDSSGNVIDEEFIRKFRISSNADHEVEVWYDAISAPNGTCVPVFNAEGGGTVAGEADVIGGRIVLKVGDTEIFRATADDSLDDASETVSSGVSVDCDDSKLTEVHAAVVTVKNDIATTSSREYTLVVRAFGEKGSIVFDKNKKKAINAGDAPAGQYDNDILIAAGTLNTYTYDETETDTYANAAFSSGGADFYQGGLQ
jgi:hypothetical protein